MKARTRDWLGLVAALVVVGLTIAILPPAAAQTASFGSQVKIGDSDFIPTVTVGNLACVKHLALGTTSNVQDDGFYLGVYPAGVALPTSVLTYDLRLVKVGSKAAGTLVEDGDTSEKGVTAGYSRRGCTMGTTATSATATVPKIIYADVNNDGRYNQGDWVYLAYGHTAAQCAFTSGAVCQMVAPAFTGDNATAATIRLSDVSSTLTAGTVVFASDSDYTSWRSATKPLASTYLTASGGLLFNADLSGGTAATLTPGDSVYVSPTNQSNASTPQLYSIRLLGGFGAFGSQVKIGDPDFIPATLPAYRVDLLHLGLGTTSNVQDDGFYIHIQAHGTAPTAVATYDIRAVKVGTKAAGTLVEDGDTSEKGVTAGFQVITANGTRLAYADVNNDGRYNEGDYVYLVFGSGNCPAAFNGGVCHLVAPALTGDTVTGVTIRLTAVSATLMAGSVVFASDSDYTSWRTATRRLPSRDLGGLAGGFLDDKSVGVFNADLSGGTTYTTATVTPGDSVYIMPGNVTTNSTVPQLYSIRVLGSFGAFGSQVKIGDADFVPTLVRANRIDLLHLGLGTTNNVQDDGFYLAMRGTTGAPTSVTTYDLRLVKVGSKAAGTLVEDADTSEKGVTAGFTLLSAPATTIGRVPHLIYADVNNDGRYNEGDWVYVTRGTNTCRFDIETCQMNAPSLDGDNVTAVTLRLTEVSATLKAGSVVFASDSDYTSWRTATKRLASYHLASFSATSHAAAFFNADLSGGTTQGTATVTPGDTIYIMPGNVSSDATTPQLYGIRVLGSAPPSGRGGTTTTTPPTNATTNVTTTPTTTTTATSPTTATTPTTTTTKKTPALELVGIVASMGAAVAVASAWRRR